MRTAHNGDVDLLRLRAQCFYSLGTLSYCEFNKVSASRLPYPL
jgi:hypothetical protein